MIEFKKFQSKSHLRTRDFVASFGDALQNPNHSERATAALADAFLRQVQKRHTTAIEISDKHSRVCAKLFASYPGVNRARLQAYAPEIARFSPPEQPVDSGAAAAALLSEAKTRAASLLGAAKAEAATLVQSAARQAEATVQAAQGRVTQTEETSAALLREAQDTRAAAKQSATGMLANAQRESSKATREAQEKVSSLEAEARALEAKLKGLQSDVARVAAPLHSKPERAFTAGGCIFHVRSDALENHPESYLSVLARTPMKTCRSEDGAFQVHDLTAKELKALCHFLNTGKAIGPLAKGNTEARELAQRFGSEAMLQAIVEPTTDVTGRHVSSLKLDPTTIERHCERDISVEHRASEWARKLARELPHAKWADGTRFTLDCSHIKLTGPNQTDIFQARPAASGSSRNEIDQFICWRGAAQALQRWFEASQLPAPIFMLEDKGIYVQFSLEFRAHKPTR